MSAGTSSAGGRRRSDRQLLSTVLAALKNEVGISDATLKHHARAISISTLRHGPHASILSLAKAAWRAWCLDDPDYHAIIESDLRSLKDLKNKLLLVVGFTPQRAADEAKVLRPISHLYSKTHLIDIVFERALDGTGRPLRGPRIPFPFHAPNGKQDVWYDSATATESDVPKHKTENVLWFANTAHPTPTLMQSMMTGHPYFTSGGGSLLFHATTWRNASSICTRGLRHFRGKDCLDFGVSPSFYLTDDLTVAVEWGEEHELAWEYEVAILVFSLPFEKMDERACAALHRWRGATSSSSSSQTSQNSNTSKRSGGLKCCFLGKTPNDRWSELVSRSRLCEDNELDDYDVVIGPMLRNVRAVLKGKPARAHTDARMQMAIKSNSGDRLLNDSLVGVIWMQKG